MTEPVATRRYTIDFFQLTHVSTPQVPTIEAGFNSILDEKVEPILVSNGYMRDLWTLELRSRPKSYAGQFRKFRTNDLPEIGVVGGSAAQLALSDQEGVVEKNFFVYYTEHQILGWHRNGHASSAKQLAAFLASLWGAKVTIDPVLQPDAVKRLLSGDIDLKKVELTIPRPTSRDLYPDDDYGKGILELLNRSGADSLHLTLGIDTRRKDTEGKLTSSWKRALAEFTSMGATTARAIVYDDGIEHPIDLIADRVASYQDIETNALFPPSGTMYKAIDTAREECKGAINDYFGAVEEAIT